MQVSWWNLVRFPNPLAFGSQAGTLSSETVLVLGRPCWLEWNRNNWLESEINRMALELLLDLLVSTSEKKNTDWLRELNYEAFKLFSKHIGVLCMVCVQGVSLCVLVVSAPLIWWNPSCPSWAIAVCLIAVPLHSRRRQESPYPHNPLYKCNRSRLQRWYLTIPSSDQWWTTIENHRYQWLPDPKTIGKPSFPMIVCNHSIQWWWYPWKQLELCNGSKYWLKTRTELLQMSGKVPI